MVKLSKGRVGIILGAAFLALTAPLCAPQLLAFPYSVETEIGTIHSEQPLDSALIKRITAQTQSRLAASPIARKSEKRPIFVTAGGWRWMWLANSSHGAFALTRPVSKAVIINRTDPNSGIVKNNAAIGGQRQLGPVLAHEFTHGMIRRRYGLLAAQMLPTWKVEGYCDYVAQESSLTPEDISKLNAADIKHPAIPYFYGRYHVAMILEDNGGSVDELFKSP